MKCINVLELPVSSTNSILHRQLCKMTCISIFISQSIIKVIVFFTIYIRSIGIMNASYFFAVSEAETTVLFKQCISYVIIHQK
jgi:hypothetical protein